MEETRHRVQEDQLGRRGHRADPPYRIGNDLRVGTENRLPRQFADGSRTRRRDPSFEVTVAWHCQRRLRIRVPHHVDHGRQIALQCSTPSRPARF
jgi:transposase